MSNPSGNLWMRIAEALAGILRWLERPLRPLLPPSASDHAAAIDLLYGFLVLLSGLLSLGIAGFIMYFAVKYRRGSEADRSRPAQSSLPLELAWTLIPLAIMAGIFLWGAHIYLDMFGEPDGAETIYVVGKQWMWKIRHPGGAGEINALHVPVGRPIRLVITSQDVVHSFFLPAFRVKRDAVPGRYTTFWFQATRTGDFPIFCAQYCGHSHSAMIGRIVAMEPEAYQDWLKQNAGEHTPAAAGEQAFRRYGCSGCHGESRVVRAPSLSGLFGMPVPLQGGGFAIADETYLRESIYFPQRKIVAGYEPVMPTFSGVIPEEDVMNLIAYIRSLQGRPLNGTGSQGENP